MRLKHVKGAHERIEASSYIIHNPEIEKGNYQNLFANSNPIYVEIGTGKGTFIIENAKRNPNINFIGIEKFDSVLARALEKVKEPLPNLFMIRLNASKIQEVFYQEVDLIYLNFSDPWPKKRHEKREIVYLPKVQLYIFNLPISVHIELDIKTII